TFNAETQERQQELMKAWLSLGATYKTVREVNIETSKAAPHGPLGHHHDNKITNMSTQPTEGREAELAYTSLVELEPEMRTGSSAYNPSPATTKHHDQHAANASTASHFVP
ncbi:Phospholipid hydroperoxide glutathione, partial [Globisporangium polare]